MKLFCFTTLSAFSRNNVAFIVILRFNLQYMFVIDDINHNILQELEANGRISNVDLAERVGLSASACLRRVQELESSGIIQGYRAVLNRRELGAAITIFVLVGLSAHLKKDAKAFERAMNAAPQVRECHNVTGSIEYILRVEVAGLEAYKEFHTDILGTLSQVGSITSYITLGTAKDLRA